MQSKISNKNEVPRISVNKIDEIDSFLYSNFEENDIKSYTQLSPKSSHCGTSKSDYTLFDTKFSQWITIKKDIDGNNTKNFKEFLIEQDALFKLQKKTIQANDNLRVKRTIKTPSTSVSNNKSKKLLERNMDNTPSINLDIVEKSDNEIINLKSQSNRISFSKKSEFEISEIEEGFFSYNESLQNNYGKFNSFPNFKNKFNE